MRLYSFVNANYLKHIQHGIQTAHCVAELYNKYPEDTVESACIRYDALNDWARNHKTIIILDGGNCLDLQYIVNFFLENEKELNLPWAYFKEDASSLNNALTAVAVVVPDKIYSAQISKNTLDRTYYSALFAQVIFTPTEEKFYHLLKSKDLAR